MLKKKLNKKGFSLVELIVVIAIMAILAAIIIPTVTNKINDANKGSADQAASGVANGIQSDITSINAGLTTNLTYLSVTGEGEDKTISVNSAYGAAAGFEQGNATVTITKNDTAGYIIVKAKVGNQDSDTYNVAIADGKITIGALPGSGT